MYNEIPPPPPPKKKKLNNNTIRKPKQIHRNDKKTITAKTKLKKKNIKKQKIQIILKN